MARPRTKNKHLPKYVTIIHGSYWYRPPKVKPVRISQVGDEAAMYRFMAERTAPMTDLVTIGDCMDRYIREVLPTLAASTQKDYRRYIGTLRAWCGHMRPGDLTRRDVGRLIDVTQGKIARNRMVAVLSALYGLMVGYWYVAEQNPCIGVRRHKARKRDRYVTQGEYDAVYALASTRMRIAMDLALLTGQRQGDILRLRWDSVSKDGIVFRQQKTGKGLDVGLSPSVQDALDRAKRLLPHFPRQYVLRRRDGLPYSSDGFRAIWGRLMRKAVATGAIQRAFTFHDLRRKSGSDSVSLQSAFERLGHSDIALTRSVYDCGIRKVTPLR